MSGHKKHTKHAALEKPIGGEYHRNEWSIIGAPCDIISALAKDINQLLKGELDLGYLDADHKKGRKKSSFKVHYTDKISFQSIQFDDALGLKQKRKTFGSLDLLLINGNHFIGDKQIVLINDDKKESLQRKLDRLTNIKMILLPNSKADIYDFVLEQVSNESEVNVFTIDETAKIAQAIYQEYIETVPPVFGLILAGGKSQRMGKDKGALQYYGKFHREYLAEMSKLFCHQVFISCRKNQDELIDSNFNKLYDTFEGLGPFGAILSAFREKPNQAWLSLACDLPYLDKDTLNILFEGRNPRKLATCFYNPETDFPEPLITIWEPKSYPVLLEFLSQGYACPRKVLINADIEMITLKEPMKLNNANDPDAYKEALAYIKQNQSVR